MTFAATPATTEQEGTATPLTAPHTDQAGRRYADLADIQQMLARYAVAMTQGDTDRVLAAFTPDGSYSAFGDTYPLDAFPALIAAAPKGLFMTGTPVVEFAEDGETATGTQPLCFVEHSAHDMRIGYYNDTYRRTPDGWRLHTRAMTFIRRSGAHDSGRPHAFERTRS
ncbi:nuclear transport factor 2 family protein [Streptomyces sp. NPDC002088]|uniref:nuclear transport factor 2 family protein n=1 Tax=Streptomyces sp. NPDC002088 TaxID=3154665 RepID=UPI00331F10F2